jgi:hypothetical protein
MTCESNPGDHAGMSRLRPEMPLPLSDHPGGMVRVVSFLCILHYSRHAIRAPLPDRTSPPGAARGPSLFSYLL